MLTIEERLQNIETLLQTLVSQKPAQTCYSVGDVSRISDMNQHQAWERGGAGGRRGLSRSRRQAHR